MLIFMHVYHLNEKYHGDMWKKNTMMKFEVMGKN